MLQVKADLHIHTCLSPCGDLDMTPRNIIKRARQLGLEMIAITDHNACGNVTVAQRLGKEAGVYVLAGVEITTKEEVHLLGLFEEIGPLKDLEGLLRKGPSVKNTPEIFGYQVLVNEYDEVEGFVEDLLIHATLLSLEEAISQIHSRGGLSIPAHVDKPSFSILSQLGFIPEAMEVDALEIWNPSSESLIDQGIDKKYPLVCNSDAHFVHEIGKRYTIFQIESLNLQELSLALRCVEGRSIKARCVT